MSVLIKGMEMPSEQYGKMVITLYPNGHVAEYVGDIGRVWEAVPVPPHEVFGTWEWDPDGMDWGIGAWKCSNCGSKAETWWAKDGNSNPLKFAGSHYCGNCGATMRK